MPKDEHTDVPKRDTRLRALVISKNGGAARLAHALWMGRVDVVYVGPVDARLEPPAGMTYAKSWRPHLTRASFIICDDVATTRKCVRAVAGRAQSKRPKVLHIVDAVPPVQVQVRRKPWWKFWSR